MAELKKYQYTWKEYTMVKTHKNSDKVKVVEWEIFESELEIRNTYIKEVKGDVEVSKPVENIIKTSEPEKTLRNAAVALCESQRKFWWFFVADYIRV